MTTATLRDPGVVHEHVDPAELVARPAPANALDAVEVREVDGPHPRVGRVLLHAVASTVAQPVLAPGADADGRTRGGEPLGERGADARRRARHQHVLARDRIAHGAPFVGCDAGQHMTWRHVRSTAASLRACPRTRRRPPRRPGRGRHRCGGRHRPGDRGRARPVRRRRRDLRPRRRRTSRPRAAEIEAAAAGRTPACSTSATGARSRAWLSEVASDLRPRRRPGEQRRRRVPGRVPRRQRQGPGRAHPRELHQRHERSSAASSRSCPKPVARSSTSRRSKRTAPAPASRSTAR